MESNFRVGRIFLESNFLGGNLPEGKFPRSIFLVDIFYRTAIMNLLKCFNGLEIPYCLQNQIRMNFLKCSGLLSNLLKFQASKGQYQIQHMVAYSWQRVTDLNTRCTPLQNFITDSCHYFFDNLRGFNFEKRMLNFKLVL